MFGKKFIAALAALIFISSAPVAMGKRADTPATFNGLSDNPNFGAEKQESIVFAQNDNTAPDDNEKSKSESEAKGSERVDEEKKSSKEASKPLAPFVPSEKIPGEQAVDFPVDI